MAKKIISNLEHPRDIAPAALQFLIHDGFQRLDGETIWNNETYKYSIYKVTRRVGQIIRIDLRKVYDEQTQKT